MPLVNGVTEPLVLPSAKHSRVIYDQSKKWRYRVLYGGRNGYKDWSFAAAAIERGVRVKTDFLFTREVQLTIADSNKKLLDDTIVRLGYQEYFKSTNNRIDCLTTGSSFIFRGLNDQVSKDIKSTEGIDVCVLCEAESLTEQSFIDLDPTIRKKDSEIWIMFNTGFDTDFIYDYFITNTPDNAIVERVTYKDAPDSMLSDVIKDQADRMRGTNKALYDNVWLGLPRTLGLFFYEYGRHNLCAPFVIPEQDDNRRLIASLDHGIAHNTSFGLMYLAPDGQIYRIWTYSNNGGTTRSHAEAIVEILEASRFSRYLYPSEVYYDYAMATKKALNEHNYRSDLDEYIEVFGERLGGKETVFIPANKRKVDGCHILRQVLSNDTGRPILQMFDGLNDPLIASLKKVVTDKIEPEMYAKADGDDEVDELRYGIMGAVAKAQAMKTSTKSNDFKVPKIKDNFRVSGGLR